MIVLTTFILAKYKFYYFLEFTLITITIFTISSCPKMYYLSLRFKNNLDEAENFYFLSYLRYDLD
jgi:hypothetical protein